MLRGTQAKTPTGPLVFKAWITDWAGRKILELPAPVPYTGSNFDYHLVLEGAHGIASPNPSVTGPTSPPLSGATRIEGQISFNAYKGLPVGSQILIDLERQDYRALPAQIASQRLSVTGTQGPVNFTLDVKRADLDPKLPAPSLRVRIIDTRGRILFSNPGGTPLKTGRNHINLRPSPNY
ncbi:MAG TPA: hypothetical protein ENK01_02840 [Hellea balneolensis]|uniref:Uncharacterized protein n=1 Tax=Hellea balneolensis TaxID=287478 RepID=A0A7V5NXK0_9PROT|nr:hypothetical protein [Hellea balneolensis]